MKQNYLFIIHYSYFVFYFLSFLSNLKRLQDCKKMVEKGLKVQILKGHIERSLKGTNIESI